MDNKSFIVLKNPNHNNRQSLIRALQIFSNGWKKTIAKEDKMTSSTSKTCGCIILVIVAFQMTTDQFSFHCLEILYSSSLHFDRLPGLRRMVTHTVENFLLSSS